MMNSFCFCRCEGVCSSPCFMVMILCFDERRYFVITSLLWVKTMVDRCTCMLGKALKGQCQCLICEETFNGDGPVAARPLKTIKGNGVP